MDDPVIELVSATATALGLPELLFEVVSHLDEANLAQTALVSRAFRTASEAAMYDFFSVVNPAEGGRPDRRRMEGLVATLERRSDLASKVKTMGLIFVGDWSAQESTQTELETKLLGMCHSLRTLHLEGKLARAFTNSRHDWLTFATFARGRTSQGQSRAGQSHCRRHGNRDPNSRPPSGG